MAKPSTKRTLNIVSVQLSPLAKGELDGACEQRGMTIKSLLSRLIEWFAKLDKTGQSTVLGQIDASDAEKSVSALMSRHGRK